MVFCSVSECENTSKTCNFTNKGITFHMFPKDPYIKDKWISASGRRNWFPTKFSRICSVHFTNEQFNTSTKRRNLLKTAVPTVDVWKFITDLGSSASATSSLYATPGPSSSYVTDDFSQNDSKVNVCLQKTCLRCKRSIQHTTAEDQTKKLIAKVYHYFECEFEELRNQFGDFDLTPWSKFRQRTALATGVSETEILQILKEEESQNAEEEQEKSLIRARKRSMYTESSTMEEESSDNNLSDEEQPTPEQGVQNEFETLVVKFEPECDRDQVQTTTEFVEVKVEPSDADEETYIDMPALKEDPIIKRKGRKTPRKEVTSKQQNTQGELWTSGTPSTARLNKDKDVQSTQYEPSTSGTSSSVRLTQDQHGSGLLGVDEVKEEKIDIDEEGIS